MPKKTFDYKLGPQAAGDRAKEFMGNNIVRGIVELVTNSDAAYQSSGSNDRISRPIVVSVNTRGRSFEVLDQASGMSYKLVEEKFTEGGSTSEEWQRGFFGLGAKDCAAFGSLTLQTIDQAGTYSTVHIPGNFKMATMDFESAQDTHYSMIHDAPKRRPGTRVTISVEPVKDGGARIPQRANLQRQLLRHFALRNLLTRSRLFLRYQNKRESSEEELIQEGHPWETREATCIFSDAITLPGYPESSPFLRLFSLAEPIDKTSTEESFEGFILVGTSGVADYGFTLAGQETHAHANRLVGYLDDTYIQSLLSRYRQHGATGDNPKSVVSQDRRPKNGGLDSQHPYTVELMDALRPIVSNALARLQEESNVKERAAISPYLSEANRNAELLLSGLLEVEGSTTDPSPLPRGFYFIPSSKALQLNDPLTRSMSIYSVGEHLNGDETVTLHVDRPDLVTLDAPEAPLARMNRAPDGYRATIRLAANAGLGSTRLHAAMNGKETHATIRVVEDPPRPQDFQFERQRYSVRPGRRRTVRVLVPEELIDERSSYPIEMQVVSDDNGIELCTPPQIDLFDCRFDSNKVTYVAEFGVEGRRVGSHATLISTLGDLTTTSSIHVGGGTFQIYFDDAETAPPNQRAKVFDVGLPCSQSQHLNELCLHVFARHHRLDPFLGDVGTLPNGELYWRLTDSPGFRAMYADCIAEAAASFRLLDSNELTSSEPAELFESLWTEKTTFLRHLQSVYIDSAVWNSQSDLNVEAKGFEVNS